MPAQATDEVDWNNQDPATVIYKIGIYGWRKRCIYFLILLIMVITIVNLSLVIWVMRVMDFNLVNTVVISIMCEQIYITVLTKIIVAYKELSFEYRELSIKDPVSTRYSIPESIEY